MYTVDEAKGLAAMARSNSLCTSSGLQLVGQVVSMNRPPYIPDGGHLLLPPTIAGEKCGLGLGATTAAVTCPQERVHSLS